MTKKPTTGRDTNVPAGKNPRLALSGCAAGLVNGLFGGGGGMALVPALEHWGSLPEEKRYPTSVAVMLPVCALSAAVYFFQGEIPLRPALPFLFGGLIGGLLGGKLYQFLPLLLLRRIFAAFLLYAGFRYLLF